MEDTDGLRWRKASRSSGNGAECVEVGTHDGRAAGIRDSKSPERGHLVVTPTVLGALLASVKRGELEMRLGTNETPGSSNQLPGVFCAQHLH
jgi:hypothetical protein